jgi:hypothetical protein
MNRFGGLAVAISAFKGLSRLHHLLISGAFGPDPTPDSETNQVLQINVTGRCHLPAVLSVAISD